MFTVIFPSIISWIGSWIGSCLSIFFILLFKPDHWALQCVSKIRPSLPCYVVLDLGTSKILLMKKQSLKSIELNGVKWNLKIIVPILSPRLSLHNWYTRFECKNPNISLTLIVVKRSYNPQRNTLLNYGSNPIKDISF